MAIGQKVRLATAFGLAVGGAEALVGCVGGSGGSRPDEIAERGATVIPFDLDKTHHTFEQNAAGGVESIRALDPKDASQIGLIRTHLQAEAEKFATGDFSDPMAIHGAEMPGVAARAVGEPTTRYCPAGPGSTLGELLRAPGARTQACLRRSFVAPPQPAQSFGEKAPPWRRL